ncbi:MAG: serine/threonine-protein phosphatase [Deltaproteobacteria bacterium]|nr:serine/threonine-protein phosphatase [Deltaproteobacteria bacterium]MBK8237349.1 serine/threonine-protein phosphatase [Deltaproteobacteria bacterium]MBK8720385.1 serine/threonine-protein phosphatase [Deltaproteobacteria bacterium]MBP7285474.1 serine/threonine-protein phosphatase [Nannocystaceae bacterium]
MRIIAWPATDVGRVRSHNEDSHLVDVGLGLYLVADGMGGHAGGAHASQLCVDVVDKVVRRGADALGAIPIEHRGAAIAELLGVAASEASARIFDQANSDHRLQGMGTTLTGMWVCGERGYIVHVGDSRAFLLRGGTCRQLTNDHSWLNEQVQAGMLTEEEAAASDLKHIITRSVGFERFVDPDIIPVSVNLGDAFLLCSDGFSNYVESDEIAVLARDHWYADLPRVCTEYANKRGGDDNITVVVMLACNDRDERRPQPAYRRTSLETLPPGGG